MACILVVDDRPTNRQFLVTLLGYSAHRLLEAADGAEALQLARAEHPDLVITDLLMPTMDGYEFVQSLRAEPAIAAIPVIFYSAAYSVPEALALGRSCGVKTVLPKPSDPQVILDAVNRELDLDTPARAITPPSPVENGDRSGSPSGEVGPSAPSSEQVGQEVERLRNLIARLTTLEQLGARLISERSPGPIVDVFADAAVAMLAVQQVAVCLLDPREKDIAHIAARGVSAETLRSVALDHGRLPGSLLRANEPVRHEGRRAHSGDHPPGLSTSAAFLGLPIRTGSQILGWMYFADKLDATDFDQDDERLAVSMAARLAVVYENATLYETVQRHAAQLQLAITDRERSEAELRESEQRFRQMAENIHEVFFLTDPAATQMLYVSPAYADIWGASCRSLYERPRSWSDAIHPDDRERAYAVFGQMETEGAFELEYRIQRPDGGVRWIRARGFPIRSQAGEIYRVAGIAEDITRRKQAEIDLRRTNRALEMLSTCNEALIRAVEEDALLHSICRIAVEIGGYRIARVAYALHDQDRTIEVRAHAGELPAFLRDLRLSWAPDRPEGIGPVSQSIRSGEVLVIPTLTEERSLQVVATEIREARLGSGVYLPLSDGPEVFGVLVLHSSPGVEVSEGEVRLLRELAADLAFGICTIRGRVRQKRADEALQSSLREKEALLKEVHHRVKNNLQVITSLLRLESNRVDHDRTRAVLKDMQNRIHSMAALHETLYRSGNFAQVDLAAYLRQLTGQLARSLVAAPAELELHLDLVSVGLGLDRAIPCGLIVNELVSNALKHGVPTGRRGAVWIDLHLAAEGGLLLRVRDDGIGLPPDFEARRSKSLGLQLVADLARQINGKLAFGQGPGAWFEVTFARGKDDPPGNDS